MKTQKIHKDVFIDQYGSKFYASTIKELKEIACLSGKVFKIFQDTNDGKTIQVGTGIGRHWFTRYTAIEKEI